MRGFKINVAMAEMSTPKAPPTYDQGYLPDQCPHFIFYIQCWNEMFSTV